MRSIEIKRMQEKIGATPDGFWGPKSIAACHAHLIAMMPTPHPFPEEEDVEATFGPHGEEGKSAPPTKEIILPFPIYYGTAKVTKLSPHRLCADSLLRVFERLAAAYPTEEARRKAGILTYNGLYNPRKKRGGSSWSMHSWAIAIDFDAGRNGNRTSAGAFWGRDAMHFQATHPGVGGR